MRLRARDHDTSSSLIGRKAEAVQVRFTLRLRDQRSMWMQYGCKVYMDSHMASNGSCFMVTWIVFKNHLLEVGLTQNRETMALPMLKKCWFILFFHVWGLTNYTCGYMIKLHDFEGVLGRHLDIFFLKWSQFLACGWMWSWGMWPCGRALPISTMQLWMLDQIRIVLVNQQLWIINIVILS